MTLALVLTERNGITRAEQSRAGILAAAANSFMQHGFSATSIDDVARRLGATKGMIYHHFPSKNDLFFAVYRRGMEINFEAVEPYLDTEDDAAIRLQNMAHAHAVTMMSHQAFQRTVTQGVVMHQTGATTSAQRETLAELIIVRDQYEALFSKAIADAIRADGRQFEELSLLTKSFLAVLNGAVHWYRERSDDPAAEQNKLAKTIVAFALRGIGLNYNNEVTQ